MIHLAIHAVFRPLHEYPVQYKKKMTKNVFFVGTVEKLFRDQFKTFL